MSMTEAKPKRLIDWEKAESQYRVGVMSLREIAADHGITEGSIRKRAKRDDWVRDLAGKVTAKADALVRSALVRTEARSEAAKGERGVIELEATVQARVRISHRSDIGRSRTLTMRLLEELEAQTSLVPELDQLGELLAKPDKNGVDRLNDLYQKVISLPGRTKTMKDLADTLKGLIGLEREAFGLNVLLEGEKRPLDRLPDEELSERLGEMMKRMGR
jgi:hypothetical protein